MKFDLAIFDIDGTLLDSREFIFGAYEHIIKKHNLPKISRKTIAQHMHPLEVSFPFFFPNENQKLLIQSYREFQANNFHLATPFTETVKTLIQLKNANVIIAALTNRAGKSVMKTLENAKIEGYFAKILTSKDVEKPKPHPDSIYKLLEEFSVSKNKAIMIGDGAVDVECGKNAGIATIGVTYGLLGKDIALAKPDYVVDDISDILPIILS